MSSTRLLPPGDRLTTSLRFSLQPTPKLSLDADVDASHVAAKEACDGPEEASEVV